MTGIPMEIEYLRTLIAVAELGSFSLAAEKLHVTQPTVSRRIAAIEDHYGQLLLVRGAGRIAPTTIGQHAIDEARRIVGAERNLREVLAHRPRLDVVRLGCTPNFAAVHLGRLLGRVETYDPHCSVTATICVSAEVAAGVASGRLDVGFLEHCGLTELESLAAREIGSDEVVFVSSRTRLTGAKVEIAELLEQPLYSCPAACCTRMLLEHNLRRLGLTISDFHKVLDVNDLQVLRAALLERGGVAFVSRELMATELADGTALAHTVSGFLHRRRRTIIARNERTADHWRGLWRPRCDWP